MTFIDPYKVHVLSQAWSKLNNNCTITFSKPLKSGEFIVQNKIVHESRLIQFLIHGSRLNKKKITSRGPKKILLS